MIGTLRRLISLVDCVLGSQVLFFVYLKVFSTLNCNIKRDFTVFSAAVISHKNRLVYIG